MESGLADLKLKKPPLIEMNEASLISNWKIPTWRTESGLADLKLKKLPLIERNQASLISNWKIPT